MCLCVCVLVGANNVECGGGVCGVSGVRVSRRSGAVGTRAGQSLAAAGGLRQSPVRAAGLCRPLLRLCPRQRILLHSIREREKKLFLFVFLFLFFLKKLLLFFFCVSSLSRRLRVLL